MWILTAETTGHKTQRSVCVLPVCGRLAGNNTIMFGGQHHVRNCCGVFVYTVKMCHPDWCTIGRRDRIDRIPGEEEESLRVDCASEVPGRH